jgi:hypothetical protein
LMFAVAEGARNYKFLYFPLPVVFEIHSVDTLRLYGILNHLLYSVHLAGHRRIHEVLNK